MTSDEVLGLYTQLGVGNLTQFSEVQARGDCPLCDNPEGHFYARLKDGFSKANNKPLAAGMWQCKYCNKKGNQFSLLRELHEHLRLSSTQTVLTPLASNRKLPPSHLYKYGVVYNPVTCEYLVPVYNQDSKLVNFVRYDIGAAEPMPYNLSGLNVHPFGLQRIPKKLPKLKDSEGNTLPPIIYITEGIWDYLAFEWLLDSYIKDYKQTYGMSPPKEDIPYHIGSPGTGFPDIFLELLAGYDVRILFDNDEPGKNAVKTLASKLVCTAFKVRALAWPDKPELIKKDIRDIIINPALIA